MSNSNLPKYPRRLTTREATPSADFVRTESLLPTQIRRNRVEVTKAAPDQMNNLRHKRPHYNSNPNHARPMKENTDNELEHLTWVLFIIGRETQSRVITTIRQARYSEQKHLTILLKDGPHTDTHPKRNGPRGSLFGPSAQEGKASWGPESCRYLAASCG